MSMLGFGYKKGQFVQNSLSLFKEFLNGNNIFSLKEVFERLQDIYVFLFVGQVA